MVSGMAATIEERKAIERVNELRDALAKAIRACQEFHKTSRT
jgi:hypothetical protein